jgi:hypothetical protein
MFIATSATSKPFAPLGARPGSVTTDYGKAIALLWSAQVKKRMAGYKRLAPLGRTRTLS